MHRTPNAQRELTELLERRTLLNGAGVLLSQDFNTTTAAWTQEAAVSTVGVKASVTQTAAGTIDVEGGTAKTGAAVLAASSVPASGYWSSQLSSGPLALSNTQSNLALLTVGFHLSTTQIRPVLVTVTSYDAAGKATGSLEKYVVPDAANYLQRYSFELSSMLPAGGKFDPTATRVSFGFAASSHAGWSGASAVGLTVDNFNFARPAYYVDGVNGSDRNDGKTEATAFKTPQAAANVVQPGDIVLLKNGTYTKLGNATGALTVTMGGTPADWVTFKNYPGQSPLFLNEAYSAIKIGAFTNSPNTGPGVGYVEFRGLHCRGTADTLPDNLKGTSDPRANEDGIAVDGRAETHKPHDIRIADNFCEYLSGGGIGVEGGDRVQIENNTVQNCCWWTIYAGSGISILSTANFDGVTDSSEAHYTRLISGNVVSGNQCFEKWVNINDYSDGNGIIIDVNHDSASTAHGRTLAINNVAFNNGGGGVHSFLADHVDIFHNTAYDNSASVHEQYAQIDGIHNTDVRIWNNIAVAPHHTAGEPNEPVNSGSPSFFRNNLYFGGDIAPTLGTGDTVADPQFVAPSLDPAAADFRLKSTSPAINAGYANALLPTRDSLGNVRNGAPDLGVYEYYAATPTIVDAAAATAVVNNAATLTVVAGDDRGPAGLTYTWSAISKPAHAADPAFSRNGLANADLTTATFTAAGAYTFAYTLRVTAADAGGATAVSTVNIVVPGAATPLTLMSVVSRKTHGAAKTFDLPISLTSSFPTIEPRLGGASTLVITLSKPAVAADGTLSANEFAITGGAVFQSVVASGNTLVLTLAKVADKSKTTIKLQNLVDASGSPIGGRNSFVVGSLYGDVNRTGVVNSTDISLEKKAVGWAVNTLNYLYDVNANGVIDATDLALVTGRSGDILK